MTAIIDFPPPHATGLAAQETVARRRVMIGSRALSVLFAGLFGVAVALAIAAVTAALLYRGDLIRVGPDAFFIGRGPEDWVVFSTLPLAHRSAYAAAAVFRLAPVVMLFWTLHRLFGGYARGEVFSPKSARRFSALGFWLCAYAAAPFVTHMFLSTAGYEIDRRWAHLVSVQALVIGALVFVIGQVMQVGREIDEDRQGFV